MSDAVSQPRIMSGPFTQFLGMQIASMQGGVAQLHLPLRAEFLNSSGIVHGGVISALIDSAAGAAAFSVVEQDEYVVTIDLNVAYLRNHKTQQLDCVGRVTWRGGTLIRVEAEVTADGEAVAKGFLSFLVRKRRTV